TDLAAPVAAVPPDLVTGVAGTMQEVARREVLHPHAAGLPHHDPVQTQRSVATGAARPQVLIGLSVRALRPRLGPIDYHPVAVHSPHVQMRGGDQDAGWGVVVTAGSLARG